MGMMSLKWEGIGTKNQFPHTSSRDIKEIGIVRLYSAKCCSGSQQASKQTTTQSRRLCLQDGLETIEFTDVRNISLKIEHRKLKIRRLVVFQTGHFYASSVSAVGNWSLETLRRNFETLNDVRTNLKARRTHQDALTETSRSPIPTDSVSFWRLETSWALPEAIIHREIGTQSGRRPRRRRVGAMRSSALSLRDYVEQQADSHDAPVIHPSGRWSHASLTTPATIYL